jgi:hypothetical protein
MLDIKSFIESKNNINNNPLIAIHNITEEKLYQLLFDLELDGIPTPSIQIKPFINKQSEIKDIDPDSSLGKFGEISFIFNQDNLFGGHTTIPTNNRSHFIYEGDAYTSRMPEIRHSKNVKAFNKLFNDLIAVDRKGEPCIDDSIIQKFQSSYIEKQSFREKMQSSELIKKLFIDEFGRIDDYKITKKKKKIEKKGIVASETISSIFIKMKSTDDFYKYKDSIIKAFKEYIDNRNTPTIKNMYLDSYSNENGLDIDMIKLIHSSEIGETKYKTVVDMTKTKKTIDKIIKEIESNYNIKIHDYINHKLDEILINPKIIENNKAVTLESLANWLRKNSGEGVEQGDFGKLEKLSTTFQKRIRTIEDLFECSNNLVDDKTIEKERKIYSDLNFKLKNYFSNNKKYGHEKSENIFYETVKNAGRSGNRANIIQTLQSHDIELNDEEIRNIIEFSRINNNRKHEYMEAKIQNQFHFKDSYSVLDNQLIQGVVLPKDTDPKIIEKIKGYKLKVELYNPNKQGDRYRALLKFKDCLIQNPESINKLSKKISFKKK